MESSKKFRGIFLPILLIIILFIFTCHKFSTQSHTSSVLYTPPDRTVEELNEIEKKAILAINKFSFALFSEIVQQEKLSKNIFFSPMSISYALGMVENGGAGTTLEAMITTLQQEGLTLDEINTGYANITHILAHTDPHIVFNLANSLWPRKGKQIKKYFTDVCQQFFQAQVKIMDWTLPGATDTINMWVHEKTNGKITEIVRPPISQSLALLLLNAIYFKGSWTIPFDTSFIDTMEFTQVDKTTLPYPMMYKSNSIDTTIRYTKTEHFEAVTIPYGKGKFCMTLLLPDSNTDMASAISNLSTTNWEQCISSELNEKIEFFLPKFKFSYEIDLNDILSRMGMSIAFNSTLADFSNMFEDGIGWIDKVKHKAFIQVDETGTEAAAVTAIFMFDSAPRTIKFNRPFIFIIHEKISKTILFMGKIVCPKWE